MNFAIPLGWSAVFLSYWLKHRTIKVKWIKLGIATTLLVFLVLAVYVTAATYDLWKKDPLSRYLLPPYQTTYFYTYSLYHYWLPVAANLLVSLIWVCFLYALNKASKDVLMEKYEIYLAFFGALAVGWPKFIVYLIFVLGLFLAKQTVNNFIFRNGNPLPIAHSLLLGALIVLLFGNYFIVHLGLNVLKI